jgi:hypothetical protein
MEIGMPARFVFFLICATTMLSATSSAQNGSVDIRETMSEAAHIAMELERCPSWTSVPQQDIARRKEITVAYSTLAKYSTDAIRGGVALYVESHSRRDPAYQEVVGKVFAFVRVVFRVPPHLQVGRDLLYAIQGNPVSADHVIDFLWPYSIDSAGELTLTGVPPVASSGPPYEAIPDFEQMENRLERRFPLRKTTTGG